MINIDKSMLYEEKEIYRVIKKKWPIPVMIIFCPLCIALSSMILISCFENLLMDSISFDSYGMYVGSILFLIIFVPMAILLPISYVFNQLIITDKRVFIRKGIGGKLIILNMHDIAAFQYIHISTIGGDVDKICFFLKCRKRIRTGELYLKKDNLNRLLEILGNRISKKIVTRKQIKELKTDRELICKIVINRNIIFPTITTMPFVLALVMLVLLIGGFNEKGVQQNIYILGTVEEKYTDYDNRISEISGYNMTVIENRSKEKYKVHIDERLYEMFEERDKIFIKAKKGSLGLIYDERFYKLDYY